jgi:hypothetical protein
MRPRDAPVVWSRSACAPAKARERRSPLDGENRNELDADAGRYCERRAECARGYGVAEHHRRLRVPDDRVPVNVGSIALARRRSVLYDRKSMIRAAATVATFAGRSRAVAFPIAIIAPPAR